MSVKQVDRIWSNFYDFCDELNDYMDTNCNDDLDLFTTYLFTESDYEDSALGDWENYIKFSTYYCEKVRLELNKCYKKYEYDDIDYSKQLRSSLNELMYIYDYIWVQQGGIVHPYYLDDIEILLYMLSGYAIDLSKTFKKTLETLEVSVDSYDVIKGLVSTGKLIQSAMKLDVVGIVENGNEVYSEMKRMKVSKFRK